MSRIILPARRIAQPQGVVDIDTAHWAGKHAKIVIIPSASKTHDLASHKLINVQANCSVKPGPIGLGFFSASILANSGFSVSSWESSGEASLIIIQQRNSTANSGWMDTGTQAGADHFPYSSLVYCSAFSSERWMNGVAFPSGADITKVHVIGISSKASSQIATYNGVQWATGASAFALDSTLTFGDSPTFGGFNGYTYEVYAFSKAFSASELRDLSLNPRQILRRTSNSIWFDSSVAVGGGATAVISTSTEAAVFSGLAQVSPLAALLATTANSVFSGSSDVSPLAATTTTTDDSIFVGSAGVGTSAALSTTTESAVFGGSTHVSPVSAISITTDVSVFSGGAQVSPLAAINLTTGVAVFVGSAGTMSSAEVLAVTENSIFAGSASGYVAPGQTLTQADIDAIAAAVWSIISTNSQTAPIHADTRRMNGAAVAGDGTSGNLWRGA